MPNKDHLLEIYKTEATRYDKTRDIQWRLNIALWSVIALAVYLKAEKAAELPGYVRHFIEAVLFIAHSSFIYIVKQSEIRSMSRMRNIARYVLEKDERQSFSWDCVENPKVNTSWAWEIITWMITAVMLFTYEYIPQSEG